MKWVFLVVAMWIAFITGIILDEGYARTGALHCTIRNPFV